MNPVNPNENRCKVRGYYRDVQRACATPRQRRTLATVSFNANYGRWGCRHHKKTCTSTLATVTLEHDVTISGVWRDSRCMPTLAQIMPQKTKRNEAEKRRQEKRRTRGGNGKGQKGKHKEEGRKGRNWHSPYMRNAMSPRSVRKSIQLMTLVLFSGVVARRCQ